MPLGDIPMPQIPVPETHYHGKTEIILGDHWSAEYFDAEETPLPEGVPALYAYACVVKGDYGYLTEHEEGDGWNIVEGEVPEGESAEEFVTRTSYEQIGATISETLLVGFLDCEATSNNEQYETHFRSVRPLYVAVASELNPVPEETGYHRRRLPMNQFQNELRNRYLLLSQHLFTGLNRYTILERTGQLKG
ncbi:MAG: hypothetical protein F4Z77_07470 [Dehalococcoidia bacterium]|nr:hypothetical protein [Dehalococcoidia bacterium]MYA52568.1 hypothetical protein [Dehalococcoidia bacterium]